MSIAEKLTAIAENEPKVYAAGKQAAGKAFWGGFQDYGNRGNYSRAFYTARDLDNWFYPAYDFNFTSSATEMFRGASCSGGFDMTQRLEECGVVMDFSRCDNLQLAFAYFPAKGLPMIDMSGITAGYQLSDTFVGCANLENLTLGGTVSVDGLNLQWSTKLSRASIESIIYALSADTSGLSITLSRTAVENAFGEGETLEDSVKWAQLIDTKPNWTINLV